MINNTNRIDIVYEGLHGDTYKSIASLAKAYNISYHGLWTRIKSGMPTQEALKELLSARFTVKDHLGNLFDTENEMCRHWGIDSNIYRYRITHGWSMEKALTTPVKCSKGCKDHLDNLYPTIEAMCKHYNIKKSSYKNRIRSGWSVEAALTTPVNHSVALISNGAKDHLGNYYQNIEEMCKHYNRSPQTFFYRLRHGWSLEKALTCEDGVSCKIEDGFGGSRSSLLELASTYNVSYDTLRSRIKCSIETTVALVVKDSSVVIKFIGLDGKARYALNRDDSRLYTARELVEKYRPDLLEIYDKYNPTGEYRPYNSEE